MRLYFIRHGQSVNNSLWDRTGSSQGRSHDPELTALGRAQAERLAQFLCQNDSALKSNERETQRLNSFDFTHLYCSLMVRAVATGAILADALKLPLVAWEDLHEEGGIYLTDDQTGQPIGQPGHNRAYFEAHYPQLVLPDTLGEDGWWNRPYEEPEQRPIRARRFWHDLIERHGSTDDRVAVVSHGGFYNLLLAALLNLPEKDRIWFVLNNAALTRIDFDADGTGLIYLNRFDYLPAELIT